MTDDEFINRIVDNTRAGIAKELREILSEYLQALDEGIDWGEAGKDLADRVGDLVNELEEE